MDFSGQIRAARAFLNLTQDQLAEQADLSLQGMQKVERGESHPTARTQKKIVKAFEKRGVLFTERGIEYEPNPLYFLEGDTQEEAYLQVLDDVERHLAGRKHPELLIMYSDDSVSPEAVNAAYMRLRAAGIGMRQLVQEGNTHLMAPLDEYRYVPKAFFINRVTLIYGDHVVTEAGNAFQFAVKVDPVNANIQRNTFNMLWSVLQQPTKSTSDVRFN